MLLVAALVRSDAILNRPAAARAGLNWTVRDLANRAVSTEIQSSISRSPVTPESLPLIESALQRAGIEFFGENTGFEKREAQMRTALEILRDLGLCRRKR